MSLMGTLAKVAIGVMVAKTVGGMLKGGGGGGGGLNLPGSGGGGPFGGGSSGGGLFPQGRRSSGGGLDDMMNDIFAEGPKGGQTAPAPRQQPRQTDPFGQGSGPVEMPEPGSQGGGGGLGDLLEQLGGRGQKGSGGGLSDILSGKGGAGGLGDLLGGLLGAAKGAAQGQGGSFGEVLNDSMSRGGEPELAPTQDQEAAAGLLLRAMIQAAKSDGRIDQAEQKRLTDQLGQATPEEMQFVQQELRAPVDIDGLCAQVPQGLGPQVYAMSLMAIDLDNRVEASYLIKLAQGLGLSREDMAQIHQQMGAPQLG